MFWVRDIYSDEQFQELLRKVDNSLITKDNIIAKDSGNIMDSKGSIFTEHGLKHKTKNTIENHMIHEHEALKNLTQKNDYVPQELIVNMFPSTPLGCGSPSIQRAQQIVDITPQQIKPELEDVLLRDINDLLRQAKRSTDMTRERKTQMINVEPNKHTEKVLKDQEDKFENCKLEKTRANTTYTNYVEKYPMTPN